MARRLPSGKARCFIFRRASSTRPRHWRTRSSSISSVRFAATGWIMRRRKQGAREHDMIGIIFLVIVAVVVLWAIAKYNGLIGMRNQVANGWRQIDVQLKRRHDLIPNLVNAVKGSMD